MPIPDATQVRGQHGRLVASVSVEEDKVREEKLPSRLHRESGLWVVRTRLGRGDGALGGRGPCGVDLAGPGYLAVPLGASPVWTRRVAIFCTHNLKTSG